MPYICHTRHFHSNDGSASSDGPSSAFHNQKSRVTIRAGSQPGTTPQPPLAEPSPADEDVRTAVDALAPYLSRLSPAVQALAVHRLAGRPGYSFLAGGEGAVYFRYSLLPLHD